MHGVDLSNNNGLIAGGVAIKASGFVYAKATEGLTFKDRDYPLFRKVARQNGKPFGGYMFLHPELDGPEQAAYFLHYADPQPGDLQPVVDSEMGEPDALAAKATFEALYCLEKAGYRPLLYSSTWYLRGLLSHYRALQGYRIWQAEYGPLRERLHVPAVVMWQFTARLTVGKGRFRVDGDKLLVRNLDSLRIPKKGQW